MEGGSHSIDFYGGHTGEEANSVFVSCFFKNGEPVVIAQSLNKDSPKNRTGDGKTFYKPLLIKIKSLILLLKNSTLPEPAHCCHLPGETTRLFYYW